jgi:plasmid replication initiation protein
VTSKNGDKIVVWANAVVDARYSLSVSEQRLILWLAAQIEKEDDALEERTIGVLEMQELAGKDSSNNGGNVYQRFEEVCKRIQGRVLSIQLDEGRKRRDINWLDHSQYNYGEGTVSLQFHNELKPALLQLKTLFAKIPLKTVFKLKGGYAIRWYEMCKAQEHLETFSMSVEELRAWLGIEAQELKPVKDLRQRAIDVAKAELDKKADLSFTYKPTKVGRRITGWTFKVKKNHPRPVQRQLPLRATEPEPSPEEITKGRASLAALKAQIRG